MNTRLKMYETNGFVRAWLKQNNYKDVHLFPHNRFSKDIHFQGLSFDGCASLDTKFVLFQIKTNCKPTKKEQEQMKKAEQESYVKILWFNKVKGKTELEVY